MKYRSVSFNRGNDLNRVFWGLNDLFIHQLTLLEILLKLLTIIKHFDLKNYKCKAVVKHECFCISNLLFLCPFTKISICKHSIKFSMFISSTLNHFISIVLTLFQNVSSWPCILAMWCARWTSNTWPISSLG